MLFIDRKERDYLRTLRAGARIHIRSGFIAADDLIDGPEGREVENSGGEPFLVLRPTYATLIPNLPRRAQVIYPKDVGTILLWGDIAPGVRVLEVGTGPGRAHHGAAARRRPERSGDLVRDPGGLRRDGARQRRAVLRPGAPTGRSSWRTRARASTNATSTAW